MYIPGMDRLKDARQIERHFKGVSNHWRIRILQSLEEKSEMTLEELWESLNANEKTISEHTRRLVLAGLIDKTYEGRSVIHKLSPYGKLFCRFIKTLQHS